MKVEGCKSRSFGVSENGQVSPFRTGRRRMSYHKKFKNISS
jgi:hypothetical protein